MKLETTLAEVELSFMRLKARVGQKGVSHAEDTGEMSATLVDLEGKISESSESSAYVQPIINTVSMRNQEMALGKSVAALQEARAKREEENATIEEDTVRREKEIAAKHTEAPLSTQEYEAGIGPKQIFADATGNLTLEDDETIAQVKEEKGDSPSGIPFTEHPEQNRPSLSDSKEELPIKFKDAVGRKFNLPFYIAATWPVRLQRKTNLTRKS